MSADLYPRAWSVRVDTLLVDALDLEFKILRSIKSVPNKCVLTLWNLNADHRAQLLKRNHPAGTQANPQAGKAQGVSVQVDAGYVGQVTTLFAGDLREVASTRDGTDWKTTLSGDDGGRAYRERRINQQFTAGTPIGTVFSEAAKALGLGLGNVANFAATAEILGIGKTLPHTLTLSGSASEAMKRLCDSIGVVWSIQGGTVQIQAKGQPLQQSAILLSPETGLYGSPEASIDSSVSLGSPQQFAPGAKQKTQKPAKPKSTSVLKCKAALIPGLVPGRKIKLESAAFDGNYMVTEAEYVGASWKTGEGTWEANLILRVYQ